MMLWPKCGAIMSISAALDGDGAGVEADTAMSWQR
jgi:hypothetical protein